MGLQLDQQQIIHSISGNAYPAYGNRKAGQTFKAGISGNLKRIDLWITKVGSPSDLVIEITTESGDLPTTTILATQTISVGSISNGENEIIFTSPAAINSGTNYAFTIRQEGSGGDSDNTYYLDGSANIYEDGRASYYVTSWSPLTYDWYFQTYVDVTPELFLHDSMTVEAGKTVFIHGVLDIGLDQEQAQQNSYQIINISDFRIAQTFKAGIGGTLNEVKLWGYKAGYSSGDFIVEIRNTVESHTKPDSTVLGSGTFSNSDLTADSDGAEFTVNLTSPAESIIKDNYYSIVIRRTSADGGCSIFYQNTDVYANGNYVYSTDAEATWHVEPYDLYFKTYVRGAKVLQETILSDANIFGTEQKTILSDAAISDQYDKTVPSDAAILGKYDETIPSDANIKVVDSQKTILSDARIVLEGIKVKSIKSDAVIADTLDRQIISNAHVSAKREKTISSDAYIRGDIFTHINSDIRFLVPEYKNINTDIRYSTDLSKFEKSDIYIQEGYYIPEQTIHIITTLPYYQWRFKNEIGGTWSAWEDAGDGEKEWDVTAGTGTKRIYYEFKTAGGLILSESAFYLECYFNIDAFSISNLKCYEGKDDTEISDSTYQPDTTVYFDWDTPLHLVPIKGYSYALDATPDDEVNIVQPNIVVDGMSMEAVSDMTVKVNDGVYYNNSIRKTYDTQNFTVDDSEDKDRIDVIYISLDNDTIKIAKETKGVSPEPATIPANTIKLAEIKVRATTTEILNSDITDSRAMKVSLDYTDIFLEAGQHTLKIKAQALNGLWSNTVTFNLYISSQSPDLTDLKCYVSEGGTEIINGQLQDLSDSGYFEWVAPDAPGDMTYYYTTDGSEPDSGSDNTTDTHIVKTMGTGSHIFKVKVKDEYGTWGRTRQFTFVYSATTYPGDTIVIGGGTILKQSLKEIVVRNIKLSLDNARTCEFDEPVDFDATGSFTYGQIISVIHNGTTMFKGKIRVIKRSMSINEEVIHYQAAGPRAELEQMYSYTVGDFGETHILRFQDISPMSAINKILAQAPEIISSISGSVSGDNIDLELTTSPISQAITEVLKKAKNYKYYVEPNGTLNFLDLTTISGKDAYFGIYGNKISTSSPQFNVLGSDLVFDNTNRFNQCIIEGSKKIEVREVKCYPLRDETKYFGYDYSKWCIPEHLKVVKLLNTKVSFAKAVYAGIYKKKASLGKFVKKCLNPEAIPEEQNFEWVWEGYHDMSYLALAEFCNDSRYQKITQRQWMLTKRLKAPYTDEETGIEYPPVEHDEWKNEVNYSKVSDFEKGSLEPKYRKGSLTEIDGYLIKFNKWITNKKYAISPPSPGTVIALVAVETEPLVVNVSVSGNAANPKVFRIYDSSYNYDKTRFYGFFGDEKIEIDYDWRQYPEGLPALFVNDTTELINRAHRELETRKNILISGSILLDTVDYSWNLSKTVNLQNTEQGDWESLNARITAISFDFMNNTTTLQLTTQYSA